jgi:hypothetical protein
LAGAVEATAAGDFTTATVLGGAATRTGSAGGAVVTGSLGVEVSSTTGSMVTSALAAETDRASEPPDHIRSSSNSGRHTMVTTTATVNERWVEESEVEVRGAAFGGGQDITGPKTRTLKQRTP